MVQLLLDLCLARRPLGQAGPHRLDEGGLDLVQFVGEVDHRRALLLCVRAVEARERLHRVHATQLLVHVDRVEQRLVEASLELVGDDQEAVLGAFEDLRRLRLGGKPFIPNSMYECPPSWTVPEKATRTLNG